MIKPVQIRLESEEMGYIQASTGLFNRHGFRIGEMLRIRHIDPDTNEETIVKWKIDRFEGCPYYKINGQREPFLTLCAIDPLNTKNYRNSIQLEEALELNPNGSTKTPINVKVARVLRKVANNITSTLK